MKSRSSVDPELHILRSLARSLDGVSRQSLESARFNLYAAFESQDVDAATRWATAVRASLIAVDGEARRLGLDALARIERAIGEAAQ